MELWSEGALVLFLAGSLVQDIKNQRISLWWFCLNGLAAALLAHFSETGFISLLSGLLPGIILFLAAAVTKERIGKGDAGMMMLLGMYLGLWACLAVLIMSCTLLAAAGVCMLFRRRVSLKRHLIFSPFLCAGYILWRMLSLAQEFA